MMMRIIGVCLVIAACAGCAGYDNAHGLSGAAGLGAGALAWEANKYESDDRRMGMTALAGLGTFAAGELIRSAALNSQEEQYVLGYQQGEADSAKRQYNIIQNMQKWEESGSRNVKVYEFPGVDHENGINYAPHSVKLRVEE